MYVKELLCLPVEVTGFLLFLFFFSLTFFLVTFSSLTCFLYLSLACYACYNGETLPLTYLSLTFTMEPVPLAYHVSPHVKHVSPHVKHLSLTTQEP